MPGQFCVPRGLGPILCPGARPVRVRLGGRLPWRCQQLATPPAGMARHSDGSEPSACTIRGRPVPGELLGPLVEFRGALAGPQHVARIRRHMAEHGYLLLRSVVDPVAVQEARACVLASLAELEEVVPLGDDRWTTTSGRSRRHALHGQYGSASLGHFWRGVSEGAALRRVTHGDKLAAVMQALAGGKQCRAQDMVYLRPVCAGACADMHYDYPFFSTGLATASHSRSIHTAWVPLGAVSPQDGALCIVEQSHRFSDLLDELQATDFGTVSQDSFQALAFPAVGHPVDEARARGVRLLSASLEPGDAIIFSMFCMHGSLDNNAAGGALRLSADVRWHESSSNELDPRYFAPALLGSNGGGYAAMNGSRGLGSLPTETGSGDDGSGGSGFRHASYLCLREARRRFALLSAESAAGEVTAAPATAASRGRASRL